MTNTLITVGSAVAFGSATLVGILLAIGSLIGNGFSTAGIILFIIGCLIVFLSGKGFEWVTA